MQQEADDTATDTSKKSEPVEQPKLVAFVAEDFLEMVRNSGKASEGDSRSSVSSSSDIPAIDIEILDQLERHTLKLSNSLDNVIERLTEKLHKASAISVGYTQTYTDATVAMGQEADEAVKSMYSLIAHCEELDKAMEPVHKAYQKIKHIKTVLAALEAQVT